MIKYSIKDLERISGIKAHTIRIWEQRYAVLNPTRTETNIREYRCADLRKLITFGVLNSRGMKISKLVQLSEQELSDQMLEFSRCCDDTELHIKSLKNAMVALDENQFEDILEYNIGVKGVEETLEKVLYPFLKRIGTLWQLGSITPTQKHFITHLIRQKLIAAIDECPSNREANAKTMLAFLPEGEWFELSLLFYAYKAKSHGVKLTYLGQSTPYEGMMGAATILNPDFILTSFTQCINIDEILAFAKSISEDLPGQTIIFGGLQCSDLHIPEKNVHVLQQVEQLSKWID